MQYKFIVRVAVAIMLLIVPVALLAGCDSESWYVGKWEIDTETIKKEAEKEAAKKDGDPTAELALEIAELMRMDLELRADHTFTADVGMGAFERTQTGTWKKVEGAVILTVNESAESIRLVRKDGHLHAKSDEQSVDDSPFPLKRVTD